MTAPTSLLDWILGVLRDPTSRAAFQANPEHYAARHGFQDLSAADVHDALYLIADNGSASYDHKLSSPHEAHYPPPAQYDTHTSAAHYLSHYITDNYQVINADDPHPGDSVHQISGSEFHSDPLAEHADVDPVLATDEHHGWSDHDRPDRGERAGHQPWPEHGAADRQSWPEHTMPAEPGAPALTSSYGDTTDQPTLSPASGNSTAFGSGETDPSRGGWSPQEHTDTAHATPSPAEDHDSDTGYPDEPPHESYEPPTPDHYLDPHDPNHPDLHHT